MEPKLSEFLLQLLIIVILTGINGLYASAEIAIASVNKNKLKILIEDGNKKAKKLSDLSEDLSSLLATTQVVITFAAFLTSAFAATTISTFISSLVPAIPISISVIFVTIILTYYSLVFGELVPKRMALKSPEKYAMTIVGLIGITRVILKPFVQLLSSSTNLVLRIFGFKESDYDERVSKEELKSFVEIGQEQGVINDDEVEMINSIIEFDDKVAREVMTPRTDVYCVNIKRDLNEYLDEYLNMRHARIPIYEEDVDNIVGILFLKDFVLEAAKVGFLNVDISKIMKKPYFVPETVNINLLFKDMQNSKNHMSVIIDEHGGFAGIITIEDLIEEVMGELDDEYDIPDIGIKELNPHTYLIDGKLPISEFDDYFKTSLEEEDFDTLSGFLVNKLGQIPENGSKITIVHANFVFKVEKIDHMRIELVKLIINQEIMEEKSTTK